MRISGTFRWMVLSVAAILLPLTANAASDPDPMANEMLSHFIKDGAKPYFMGAQAGLNGWLLIKDGKTQVVYQPIGTQYLMVGMVFEPGGGNLTLDQVKEVTAKNPEIAEMLPKPLASSATPTIPSNAAAAATTSSLTPATATAPQDRPGEKLVKDLLAASGVTLGPSTAPQLFMVMDPDCKHCRATWGLLRDSVLKGTLQVHMIPIGAPDSDAEKHAAEFIHKTNPLDAWDKYYNGDGSQLAGTPDPAWITAVRANHALIDSWGIDTTPLLAYRSKSGEVNIVRGEIQQSLSLILNDMAP